MARKDAPLKVEIPRREDEQPAWSRVGIVGVAGFVLGIAWPRGAAVRVGPRVPGEHHATAAAGPDKPSAEAAATGAPAAPSASASAAAAAPNQELAVVGPGKILKCRDKKDSKIDDCE